MKKKAGGEQDAQDVTAILTKIQEQLTFLEKKIDALVSQSREKPFKTENQPKPFQRFDRPHHQREQRQDNNFGQRQLHRAICADCSKECEVPFKPSQDRPVYCKDCFSKRKGGGSFKSNFDKKPWERGPERSGNEDRAYGADNKKKLFKKKRPAVKRRKARG